MKGGGGAGKRNKAPSKLQSEEGTRNHWLSSGETFKISPLDSASSNCKAMLS